MPPRFSRFNACLSVRFRNLDGHIYARKPDGNFDVSNSVGIELDCRSAVALFCAAQFVEYFFPGLLGGLRDGGRVRKTKLPRVTCGERTVIKDDLWVIGVQYLPSCIALLSFTGFSQCLRCPAFAGATPNSLWIGNDGNGAVGILNTDTSGLVLRTIAGTSAIGFAVDESTNQLYVNNAGGGGSIYNLDTLATAQCS